MTRQAKEIPSWLAKTEYRELPTISGFSWRRTGYLDKTLLDIQTVMTEDLAQSRIAGTNGWLQGIEPRCKLVATALLLLAIGSTQHASMLCAFHIIFACMAYVSSIPLYEYTKRLLPVLLFSSVMMLPAICSWVTPGDSVLTLYAGFSITKQGLVAAAFILLRSTASLAVAILLVKTTRWAALTQATRALGLPSIFILVLELTYRYLFLFLLLLSDYLLGRKSRLVGMESRSGQLEWIGSAIAGFFRLAWSYGHEITQAMQARGYGGAIQAKQSLPIRSQDVLFLMTVVMLCVFLI